MREDPTARYYAYFVVASIMFFILWWQWDATWDRAKEEYWSCRASANTHSDSTTIALRPACAKWLVPPTEENP